MRSVRHQPSNRHSSTISPQNARSRTGIDDQSEEVLILSPTAHRDRSQNPLPEFVAHPTNVISLLLTTVRVASSFLPAWPSFCSPTTLPTPISLHLLGGLSPNSAISVHFLTPLRSHLFSLSSLSSSFGCHLLFNIRRMFSGETLNWLDSVSVEYVAGSEVCRARMPSSVSGERRLRGCQVESPNLLRLADFWICQFSRLGLSSGGVLALLL
jgi:hypothetical protein